MYRTSSQFQLLRLRYKYVCKKHSDVDINKTANKLHISCRSIYRILENRKRKAREINLNLFSEVQVTKSWEQNTKFIEKVFNKEIKGFHKTDHLRIKTI